MRVLATGGSFGYRDAAVCFFVAKDPDRNSLWGQTLPKDADGAAALAGLLLRDRKWIHIKGGGEAVRCGPSPHRAHLCSRSFLIRSVSSTNPSPSFLHLSCSSSGVPRLPCPSLPSRRRRDLSTNF